MAGQSITFDFLSRGAATLSRDFSKIGDDAALSSRGVQVLQDTIERLGAKENRTTGESKILAAALRQTGDAADRVTAKAVLADAAIGRLGEQMKNADKNAGGLTQKLQDIADSAKAGGPSAVLGAVPLALPAVTTLAGVTAGAGIGLAGAFTAGALALGAFGAVAKPVLTDTLAAQAAIVTAQNNYTAAIASGVKPAVAYKAEQLAINKAYANLGPQQIALTNQLMGMANAWDDLKNSLTPVVAGALQPWLKGVTDLTKQLAPIIRAVSPVIHDLGQQFNALINSAAFRAFRDFIANTGSAAVGAFGGTLIDFLKAGMILLPDFNPLIEKTVGWIAGLGPAVLKWAQSKKTADDITRFMAWFSTNGPVVGDLLKNIGKALATLAPGLTAGGAAELKVISDFFAWVARLPKGIAAPLAETAGALLLLNKLGVFSVGVKFIGPVAKWLSGGLIDIGGGASAAAEIRAAFATGGAAAAAEIQAAMTGGGAVAGAEGAAGAGGAGGLAATIKNKLPALLLPISAALGPVVSGAIIGTMIRAIGDTLSPSGTFAGQLNKMFQNLSGPISTSVFHAFTFGGLEGWLTAKIGMPVGNAENNILAGAKIWGVNIERAFTGTWSNISGGAVIAWRGITGQIIGAWANITSGAKIWGSGLAGSISGTWNNIRGGAAIAWNTIWVNTTSAVSTGIAKVVGFFKGLPGQVVSALAALLGDMEAIGKAAIGALEAGAQSGVSAITSFFSSFASGIVSVFKKIWGWFSPSGVMYEGGKSLMEGLAGGIKDHAHLAVAHAKAAALATAAAAGAVTGGGSGPVGADAAAAQAYARGRLSAYGWGAGQMGPLISLWNQESGWNRFAYNASSGATGIPQALPYTKMPRAAWLPSQGGSASAGAQIDWGLGYIKSVYGSPAGAWGHEVANNWYASGTASALPGWAWVGEEGPELLRFRGGEEVRPASAIPLYAIPGGTSGPGGLDALAAELRALRAEVRQLTGVAAGIPAATGAHVGGAISAAAGAAGFRNRHPQGGW